MLGLDGLLGGGVGGRIGRSLAADGEQDEEDGYDDHPAAARRLVAIPRDASAAVVQDKAADGGADEATDDGGKRQRQAHRYQQDGEDFKQGQYTLRRPGRARRLRVDRREIDGRRILRRSLVMLIGSSMAANLLGFLVAQARSGDANGRSFAAATIDRYAGTLDASGDAD